MLQLCLKNVHIFIAFYHNDKIPFVNKTWGIKVKISQQVDDLKEQAYGSKGSII